MAFNHKCELDGVEYDSFAEAARKTGVSTYTARKKAKVISIQQKAKPNINFMVRDLSKKKNKKEREKTEEMKRRAKARIAVEDYEMQKKIEAVENWFDGLWEEL